MTKWRSFKEARKFVQSLHLDNWKEWRQFAKSGKLPNDVPRNPDEVYKNKGWINYVDWIGKDPKFSRIMKFRSFKDARRFARKLKLKSSKAWPKYCKSGKKPDDIPKRPAFSYKNKGWTDWGDFLGTGNIAARDRKYRSFEKARKFVHSLKLKNQKEWRQFTSTNKCPDDIPSHPDSTYKNKGWTDWGDFLGTGNVHPKQRKYRSFTNARKFARKLKLKSSEDWPKYCKSGKKPDDIPSTPNRVYKNKGWNGMGDWLGTGNISNTKKSQSFLSPQKAKPVIQKLAKEYGLKNTADWIKFVKSHKKLLQELHLPHEPLRFYSLERVTERMKNK